MFNAALGIAVEILFRFLSEKIETERPARTTDVFSVGRAAPFFFKKGERPNNKGPDKLFSILLIELRLSSYTILHPLKALRCIIYHTVSRPVLIYYRPSKPGSA